MKKLRYLVALLFSKAIYYMLRILKRNGTIIPGRVAIRICPEFLKYVRLPEKVIAVSGTNGKTTVSNIIINFLEENNYKVLNNRKGANVHAGITSAIIANHGKKDIAVFEVDERSSKYVYKYIKPTYIVFTNIFRDSIKRNANPEYIIGIINDSLPKSSKLIINADDLLSCKLGPDNTKIYYSIDKQESDVIDKKNIVNDVQVCPKCLSKLNYNYIRYNHIGNAYCTNCDFKSPIGNYRILGFDYSDNSIDVIHDDETKKYKLISTSIMNSYNELAAITLLNELGFKYQQINSTLDKINIVESRYSKEIVNNIEIINYLAKGQNPIACSNVFDDIKKNSGKKEVIIMNDDVHDNIESSENISWLYDCDFEFLNDDSIGLIIVGGSRYKDDYLRLLLAGVDKNKIRYTNDIYDTVNYVELKDYDKIFILYDVYSEEQGNKVKQQIKDKIQKGEQ